MVLLFSPPIWWCFYWLLYSLLFISRTTFPLCQLTCPELDFLMELLCKSTTDSWSTVIFVNLSLSSLPLFLPHTNTYGLHSVLMFYTQLMTKTVSLCQVDCIGMLFVSCSSYFNAKFSWPAVSVTSFSIWTSRASLLLGKFILLTTL